MAAPHSVNRKGRALDALMERLLMEAVFKLAWQRLFRYGLCNEDREDVAQDVVLTAYLRRETYDPARGNVEQWLSGIVRREAASFLRKRGRRMEAEAEAAPSGVSAAMNPESDMFLKALAHETLEFLPADERRVVILYEIEGQTFEAIAEIEGISVSTAHRRHTKGIEKVQQRTDEQKASGVILLPASWAAALGPDDGASGPPPEVVERAWRNVATRLGLDVPPPSEPPPSGTRRVAPTPTPDDAGPPSSSPPRAGVAWLRRRGPLVGILLGVLVGVAALERWSASPPAAVVAAAAGATVASTVVVRATAPPDAALVKTAASEAPQRPRAPVARSVDDGRLEDAAWAPSDHGRRPESTTEGAHRADMLSNLRARVRAAEPADVTPE